MTEKSYNGLKISVQSFDELTKHELYEILRARAAVFVVEQDCPYQDVDNTDFRATHITIRRDDEIIAYARVYKDAQTNWWHIGRVLTTRRNENYGLLVMKEAIEVAKELGIHHIEIEAQCYAIGFYEKVGFEVCSDEFMLDGLPHKEMRLLL